MERQHSMQATLEDLEFHSTQTNARTDPSCAGRDRGPISAIPSTQVDAPPPPGGTHVSPSQDPLDPTAVAPYPGTTEEGRRAAATVDPTDSGHRGPA